MVRSCNRGEIIEELSKELLEYGVKVAGGQLQQEPVQAGADDFIPWKRGQACSNVIKGCIETLLTITDKLNSMFNLINKSVVITGGGSGIGNAIALLFAQNGAIIHVLDQNAESAVKTAQAIVSEGGTAFGRACDVSVQQGVTDALNSIGKIDILINNAGIAHVGKAHNTSSADFDRVIDVNVKGTYNCLHAVIPLMQKAGAGVILNMCSIAASVGIPDRFAYSMSKGAVHAMTLSVARDYVADGIRCNSISPARIHTPFVDGFIAKNYPQQEAAMFRQLSLSQPIGRMGQPAEVAALALYLCSDEASFITGNDYPIDGGFITLNN